MFHLKPDIFYGSPATRNLETPKRIDPRIYLKHRQTPLLSPSRTWKVLERQDEALAYAKSRAGNGLMTFVFHETMTGRRLFLVAHPHEFWIHDIEKEQTERSSYEIIPEYTPCKLYLDLEFETEFNSICNGVQMTELFIKLVGHRLLQLYHLKINRSMILDLDSSTPQKFSRHLIYQIPFLCFASNYEVGLLVKDVCSWILQCDQDVCKELGVTDSDLKTLIIKDKRGRDKLFCDDGVYSKNRHFRLYGSTKPHKNSHLVLSPQNEFRVHIDNPKLQEEAIFMASLITNFEPIDIVVPLPERSNRIMSYKRRIISSENDPKNLPSHYPILDKFALDEMDYEGVRCWLYFEGTQCLVYESYRPCFCGNAGRIHKSNKGMLVIDLRHNHYYRKCHDPDCSGYQSAPKLLPNYIVTSLQYPNCSKEERKEITEILDLLQSDELLVEKINLSETNLMTQESVLKTSDENSFDNEVKDILEYLQSQDDSVLNDK